MDAEYLYDTTGAKVILLSNSGKSQWFGLSDDLSPVWAAHRDIVLKAISLSNQRAKMEKLVDYIVEKYPFSEDMFDTVDKNEYIVSYLKLDYVPRGCIGIVTMHDYGEDLMLLDIQKVVDQGLYTV